MWIYDDILDEGIFKNGCIYLTWWLRRAVFEVSFNHAMFFLGMIGILRVCVIVEY